MKHSRDPSNSSWIKESQMAQRTNKKTYMRSNLKKPRGLDIKVVARRLKEMSYKIPLLGGTNSKPLDDSELTDVLVRMCPQAWRKKYVKQTVSL